MCGRGDKEKTSASGTSEGEAKEIKDCNDAMHVCTQKRKRNQGAIQYKREESQTKGTNS